MNTRSMKALSAIGFAALISSPTSIGAPLKHAQITRVINQVGVQFPDTQLRNAALNEYIYGGVNVITGPKSRAELRFSDNTITRLGANTVYTYTMGTRNMTLEQGTMLLQCPKGVGGAKISTAAVTAAITGTTILMERSGGGNPFERLARGGMLQLAKNVAAYIKVLVLEGALKLILEGRLGESTLMGAGKLALLREGTRNLPEFVDVDIKKVWKSSNLTESMDEDGGEKLDTTNLNEAIGAQETEMKQGKLTPTTLALFKNEVKTIAELLKEQESNTLPESFLDRLSPEERKILLDKYGQGFDFAGLSEQEINDALKEDMRKPDASFVPGPKYDLPTTITNSIAITSNTVIITDPTIQEDPSVPTPIYEGKIYNPSYHGGIAGQFFFGVPTPDFEGPNQEVTVFRAQSFSLNGSPIINTAGGPTAVALVSESPWNVNMANLNFSALNSLGLMTVNDSITIGINASFVGLNNLFLYARGTTSDIDFSGTYINSAGTLDMEAGRNLTFQGMVDVDEVHLAAKGDINLNTVFDSNYFSIFTESGDLNGLSLVGTGDVEVGNDINLISLEADTVSAGNDVTVINIEVKNLFAKNLTANADLTINNGTVLTDGNVTVADEIYANGDTVILAGGNVTATYFYAATTNSLHSVTGDSIEIDDVDAGSGTVALYGRNQVLIHDTNGNVSINAPAIYASSGLDLSAGSGLQILYNAPNQVKLLDVSGGDLALGSDIGSMANRLDDVNLAYYYSAGVSNGLYGNGNAIYTKNLHVDTDVYDISKIDVSESVEVTGGWYNSGLLSGNLILSGSGIFEIGAISFQGNNGDNGGNLTIGAAGPITLGKDGIGINGIYLSGAEFYGSGTGGNGGKLQANVNGTITVDELDFAAGGGNGASGGDGGEFNLMASGSGSEVSIIDSDILIAGGSANQSEPGEGGNGGKVFIQADGSVLVSESDITAYGSNGPSGYVGDGGKGGAVTIQSMNSLVWVSEVDLNLDGGTGYGASDGGEGGHAIFDAKGGDLELDDVDLYAQGGEANGASSVGGKGGRVDLNARDNILLEDVYATVSASSGSSSETGGDGGRVNVRAGGAINATNTTFVANGGAGNYMSGDGGNADHVSFQAMDDVNLGTAYVYSNGGMGGYTTNTVSGNGGTIAAVSTNGSVRITGNSQLNAQGGYSDSGSAGNGGQINVTAAQDVLIAGGSGSQLSTTPGNTSTGVGGTGGNITLTSLKTSFATNAAIKVTQGATLKTGDSNSNTAGNIQLLSSATSGNGIVVEDSSQLLALAQNVGGLIKLQTQGANIDVKNGSTIGTGKNGQIEVKSNGGQIDIGGGVAKTYLYGGVNGTNLGSGNILIDTAGGAAPNGTVNIQNAQLNAAFLKARAHGTAGQLTIYGGSTLSGSSQIKLFGGAGAGGKVLFTGGTVTLNSPDIQIRANTVEVAGSAHVENNGATRVRANNHNYGIGGGNGNFQNAVTQEGLGADDF